MKPRPFHDLLFDYGCALMQQEVSVNRLRKLERSPVLIPIKRITVSGEQNGKN